MSTPPPSEHDLHAYVDGRLDGERRAAVEAYLAHHPERAAEVRAWQQDAQALRAAFTGLAPDDNARLDPSRIRADLARSRRARWNLAAAVLLSLGLGVVGGWQARGDRAAPAVAVTAAPMADAIAAHRVFVSARDFQPDRAAQLADLQAWLDANFSHPARLPDLSTAGFHAIGGRLLATEQGAAAMIVYEDAAGNAITFYVRPPGPRHHLLPRGDRQEGDLLAQYWSQGDYNYAMVSRARSDSAQVVRHVLDEII